MAAVQEKPKVVEEERIEPIEPHAPDIAKEALKKDESKQREAELKARGTIKGFVVSIISLQN